MVVPFIAEQNFIIVVEVKKKRRRKWRLVTGLFMRKRRDSRTGLFLNCPDSRTGLFLNCPFLPLSLLYIYVQYGIDVKRAKKNHREHTQIFSPPLPYHNSSQCSMQSAKPMYAKRVKAGRTNSFPFSKDQDLKPRVVIPNRTAATGFQLALFWVSCCTHYAKSGIL